MEMSIIFDLHDTNTNQRAIALPASRVVRELINLNVDSVSVDPRLVGDLFSLIAYGTHASFAVRERANVRGGGDVPPRAYTVRPYGRSYEAAATFHHGRTPYARTGDCTRRRRWKYGR